MVANLDSVSQNGGISMTDAGGSGMNSDNTNDNRKQQDNACKGLQKAQEETLVLKKLRMMFLCCILIIAILASVGIYYFTHFNEVKTFESSFNSYGNKILAAIQSDTVKKIEALDSLSSSFTLHATNLMGGGAQTMDRFKSL